MARSMTAYGRAAGSGRGKEISVELKSVNSRYLDCSVKISRIFSFLEEKVRKYLSEQGISRGKLECYISVNVLEEQNVSLQLDSAYAKSYLEALYTLRDEFSLPDDITVMRVAQNKELFNVRHEEEDEASAWQELQPVLDEAISQFIAMREREGDALRQDLLAKKAEFEEMAAKIEVRAADYTAAYRQKLEARLRAVLENHQVTADPQRILTECAIFADKTAVDEELVRLRSHCKAFGEIFDEQEPIGRKLDFLLQEMNRETNTIGSKCSEAETAALVVDMKCLLEKIREQVQNLE